MSLKKILKENLVLAMGIGLPILLVILFFLTSVLPKSMAEPPRYELLLSVMRHDYQTAAPNFEFIVRDGVLKARVGKTDSQHMSRYPRKLVLYDPVADTARDIPYDLSAIADLAEGNEIVIEEARQFTIDPSSRAPDGYSFEGPYYGGSGGLVSELFFGGYRNQGYRIVKDKAVYKVSSIPGGTYYAGNVQFIGWVTKK